MNCVLCKKGLRGYDDIALDSSTMYNRPTNIKDICKSCAKNMMLSTLEYDIQQLKDMGMSKDVAERLRLQIVAEDI